MKRKATNLLLLILTVISAFIPVSLVQAKAMKFEVNGYLTSYGWTATINSGPFEGYTMNWYSNLLVFNKKGTMLHFYETWEILDGDGEMVLEGYDSGVTRFPNGEFTGNGKVIDANDDYLHLIGRKERIGGTVDFGASPWTFTATVQIN